MMRKSWFSSSLTARKGMSLILAACWICGLLCGVFYYSSSLPDIIPLMHRTVSCSASIVGLLNAALIPFLLSALFMAVSRPWMVAGICFVKAFLFSFVSMGCLIAFGSGGWLFRFFLLFCDCVVSPVLYWYWLRHISTPVRSWWIVTSVALAIVIAFVTVLDYRVFAPFVCLIDSMKG